MTTQENINNDPDQPFDGIKENRETKPPGYFTLLFFGLIIWGILFIGYYLFSGWSSHNEFQEKMDAHNQQYSQSGQAGQ